MRNNRVIIKGRIRSQPIPYRVFALCLVAFASGAATYAAGGKLRERMHPPRSQLKSVPNRSVFQPVGDGGDAMRVAVDRESYCRQLAIESLLSLRPDFSRQSISISRNPNRPGEVIEQFAETLGEAFERVWLANNQQRTPPQPNMAERGKP